MNLSLVRVLVQMFAAKIIASFVIRAKPETVYNALVAKNIIQEMIRIF
jgi:hypothetical protein